jgi:hypothetical protein
MFLLNLVKRPLNVISVLEDKNAHFQTQLNEIGNIKNEKHKKTLQTERNTFMKQNLNDAHRHKFAKTDTDYRLLLKKEKEKYLTDKHIILIVYPSS